MFRKLSSKESYYKTIARFLLFHAIDALSIALTVLPRMVGKQPKEIKNVLVVDIAMLGDLLMATPLLRGIKECYPEAKISVVCTPWAIEALKNNPYVENVHLYEPFWEDRSTQEKPKLKHLRSTCSLLRYYRRKHFDVAFILNIRQQPFVSFIGFLSKASMVIGLKYRLGHRFLTHLVDDKGGYVAETKFSLLSVICPERAFNAKLLYIVDDESVSVAEKYVRQAFGSLETPFVCITPSTLQNIKLWKVESWVSLVNMLNSNGFRVILGGGKADLEYVNLIYAKAHNHKLCRQVADTMTLSQFSALMKLSRCLITIESAPMHLAAALRVPTVVLFGQMFNYSRFAPLQDRLMILQKEVPCARCFRGCQDVICMKFSVEEVYRAVMSIIDKGASA